MDPYGDNGNNGCQPVKIDPNIRFSSIGGLKEHIKCLREMVLFPMIYPELFNKFDTRPAKGVLFYGPPGTGKTLLARALANECSLVGGKKVTFFMRKGADCLSKWFGESERNIRELFKAASSMKPAIIFFDEIDALAPSRNNRSSSPISGVVGTLLAEMDGINDRGEIIIIGATNRPDALDPAMRRAGRFDRELYFPAPEVDDRFDILKIYTKAWDPQPDEQDLKSIAKATTGYLGSDIKALCSEAVLKAVRRVYPQIYESEYKLLIDAKNVEVTMEDMLAAMSMVTPAAARATPLAAKQLPKHCRPLLDKQLQAAVDMLREVFPTAAVAKKATMTTPSVFLVSGPCSETLLAPALLAKLEPCLVKELSIATLIESKGSQEEVLISMISECRRSGGSCILFIRDLVSVWMSLRKQCATLLTQLWRKHDMGEHTLLLAACNCSFGELPQELRELFPSYKQCVYRVREPTKEEVTSFFKPLISELPLLPPVVLSSKPLPPLPRAPPPPSHMTPEEIERRRAMEEAKLRRLRIVLREVCRNLHYDGRFDKFARPVDVTKMKGYLEIIERPMDLRTMMSKTDMQQYYCAKEFLDDIDLICANAIEYNPDKETSPKKIRLVACTLRELAQQEISEEIETAFELECQVIARRRRRGPDGGGSAVDGVYFANLNIAPDFIRNPFNENANDDCTRKGQKRLNSNADEVDKKRQRRDKNCVDQNKVIIKIEENHNGKDNNGGAQHLDHNNEKIQINKIEMNDILDQNVDTLRCIGLDELIELYGDMSKTVSSYLFTHDRMKLPQDLRSIMNRYLQLANGKK